MNRYTDAKRETLIKRILELEEQVRERDATLLERDRALYTARCKIIELIVAKHKAQNAPPLKHRGRPALTAMQRARIKALVGDGKSYRAAGRVVGVSEAAVCRLLQKDAINVTESAAD